MGLLYHISLRLWIPLHLVVTTEIPGEPECRPECVVRLLAEETGERGANAPVKGTEPSSVTKNTYNPYQRVPGKFHGDTGSAARFFHNADWSLEVMEQIEAAGPARYVPKPIRKEKDAGLEGMELKVLAPSNGAKAAQERGEDEYRDNSQAGGLNAIKRFCNHHPSVKPIRFGQWLATLLLPPAAYAPRRILVPFSGSGSEVIGAMMAGWDEIVAVEIDPEHVEVAEKRVRFWQAQMEHHESDVDAILRTIQGPSRKKTQQKNPQLSLFS